MVNNNIEESIAKGKLKKKELWGKKNSKEERIVKIKA